ADSRCRLAVRSADSNHWRPWMRDDEACDVQSWDSFPGSRSLKQLIPILTHLLDVLFVLSQSLAILIGSLVCQAQKAFGLREPFRNCLDIVAANLSGVLGFNKGVRFCVSQSLGHRVQLALLLFQYGQHSFDLCQITPRR